MAMAMAMAIMGWPVYDRSGHCLNEKIIVQAPAPASAPAADVKSQPINTITENIRMTVDLPDWSKDTPDAMNKSVHVNSSSTVSSVATEDNADTDNSRTIIVLRTDETDMHDVQSLTSTVTGCVARTEKPSHLNNHTDYSFVDRFYHSVSLTVALPPSPRRPWSK